MGHFKKILKGLKPGKSSGHTGSTSSFIKMHLALTGVSLFISTGSPTQRMKDAAVNTLFLWSTLGMNAGSRQFLWGIGIMAAPHIGTMLRRSVDLYRSSLESRTTLAVPFSHRTQHMDQAYGTLQYAKGRLSEAYSGLGSEAAMFSAKYLSRG